jgi:hypothetical protein
LKGKFNISTREATSRISSTLQHKLRVVMKCYTIKNFELDEENNAFTFNKTNRIRGIVIKDKKDYSGTYQLIKNDENIEDKEYKLIISID